ncbi:hypothetical protein AB0M20_12505 [Actinoplanes sp. NPDC051633]|uniref:hypothetical protein n=1 Tax=Actinoplanes sp. NPDC051633 TaxID=3155670 RepID=UPI00341B24F0
MKILDRYGALTGAAYVVLIMAGSSMSTDAGPPRNGSLGQQDIDHLHWLASSTSGQVGVVLELLGFAAWMLFIGYLCSRVRAGGWLATAALTGGIVSVAVKVTSAAPILTAYLLRDELTPQTARLLTAMNGLAFGVDWLPVGLFVACASAAALATRTLSRVLGWGGVVVGTVTVISTAVTGVHLDAGNPLPFLACLLWILVISVRLAIHRVPRVAPPATPIPTPVAT